MIIRLMYVLPMILGRTYDIKKNSVGVDIFPLNEIKNPKEIPEYFYSSSYKIVETSTDVKEVLEVYGDLSLGVKAGLFSFRGMGSYLRDTTNVQDAVDILTKVSFRTVSKSLPMTAKPVALWSSKGREHLGTHFVKSILYGGDLIACVRYKAVKSEYLQDIRATIKTSLNTGSALDLVGEGKLETLNKKLEKKATMEINYYATVPLVNVPNTIKGLRNLVRNFKEHVQKENNGLGVPVEVELQTLDSLDGKITYIKNLELETELKFFEEFLDDLLTTKSKLKFWIASLPESLPKEQEKQISDFSERLHSVLRKFIETIGNLNLEKGSGQLDEAKAAYRENKKYPMPGKFARELIKLKQKIVPSRHSSERGSSVYTQYGAAECTKDEYTSIVFSGYLASSPRNSSGTAFNYLCLPKLSTLNKNEAVKEDTCKIAGVKYGLLKTKPEELNVNKLIYRGVYCAVCLVKQKTSTFTFTGQDHCPYGWALQYSGFIMASTDTGKSENICVDTKYGSDLEDPGVSDSSINFVLLEKDGKASFIPCAVCSK